MDKIYTHDDKFWFYDSNHRVYKNELTGERYSSPIFIKSFRPCYLIGESKTHWWFSTCDSTSPRIIRDAIKVPKNKKIEEFGIYDSWEKVEDISWINDNSQRIVNLLSFGNRNKISKEKWQRIEAIVNEV